MITEDYSWLRIEEVKPDGYEPLHGLAGALSKLHPEGSLTEVQEKTIQLIIEVSNFMLQPGNESNPFGPIIRSNTGRSRIPEDLCEEELETLAGITELEVHPLLNARLTDILWHRRHGDKPHLNGITASEYYLLAYQENETEDKWLACGNEFRRGFRLAQKFGSDKPLHQSWVAEIDKALLEVEATTKTWDARWYLQRLSETPNPDYEDLALRTFAIGQRIHRSSDTSHASNYYEQARQFYLKANKVEQAQLCSRREGQIALLTSRKGFQRSKMAAAHHLAAGIKYLDEAGSPLKTRTLLRRKLLRWQNDSRDECHSFSHQTDISQYAEHARKHVARDNFEDAIFAFAAGHPLINYDDLKRQVFEESSQSLANFFSSSLLAEDGRTIAKMNTLEADSDRETFENHMIGHAARFDWSFRSQGYINVARWQIFNQYHPTRESLLFLIHGNPAIPPGHEELFLRGILAGFHGELIESLSLLVPQLENLIRYNLQQAGVVTSTLSNDFTQDERTLGTLLDTEDSRNFFGADLSLELKGILCSRHGYNLRNEIAHGMLSTNGFYSMGGLNLWWLAIRLLCIVQNQSGKAKGADRES